MAVQWLLKDDRSSQPITVNVVERDGEGAFSGIRCPLCHWRPLASSLWCCDCRGTPEPAFDACHTTWNTFASRGRCPGCGHQWQWTSCLSCDEFSLHEAWYEESSGRVQAPKERGGGG